MVLGFRQSVHRELTQNILPFWINLTDQENGGFFGEVAADGTPIGEPYTFNAVNNMWVVTLGFKI